MDFDIKETVWECKIKAADIAQLLATRSLRCKLKD